MLILLIDSNICGEKKKKKNHASRYASVFSHAYARDKNLVLFLDGTG